MIPLCYVIHNNSKQYNAIKHIAKKISVKTVLGKDPSFGDRSLELENFIYLIHYFLVNCCLIFKQVFFYP